MMATETATVRVSRVTRDQLAEQARRRAVSVAMMLSELANQAERDAIFQAERDAASADGGEAAVSAEDHEWESALGDGVD